MEYIILQANEPHKLVPLVNEKLKEGWTLVGGLATVSEGDTYPDRFYQAMIHE